ncbi:Asp-tRNA(Asn)/Glu-tRNA(Gln) amidotransferase subunit GatB [Candidatus Bathyarchaeota archaeon]|nr:Asp-tRNA(Asn)/Glu-tRNA(Gln) amidotransferase subunit GatB [Candidatus Bathyarchaeota archaeon]MBL7080178.1 Asp-tRNA(Asn)/Glu-tRNA(Gln) amidotransferase subunit GatB [Candidatus Bathyarchaeota archaeon]
MKAVIGLEVHVQLETESKLFCGCSTDSEGAEPNGNTCPICLGFPGAKPKVNRRAVEHAVKIARALECDVRPRFYFSRKSYFYPDMPKNFQITQYEMPLALGGRLLLDGRSIGITRVHMEEDPARLVHVGGGISSSLYTLIDHNRSGVPLVEIVTDPDLASSREARMFLEKLGLILEHLGVYDPGREGGLRVDANVSLEGGQRVEVKNITGFRAVEDALNYEIIRQESMANMGIAVERETRHYDAETNTTSTLRRKEQEEDYGYITEPDLVRIDVDDAWISRLESEMPELPDARIQRYVDEHGVPLFQAGIIVNTGLDLSRFFEECVGLFPEPGMVANWIVTFLLKSLNYEGIGLRESKVRPGTFVELLGLIGEGTITERLARELIKEYVGTGESPRSLVERRGLASAGREELGEAIDEVLSDNRKAVADYRAGQTRALDFLLGQVLRRIRARGDPVEVKRLIRDALDSE